MKINKLGLVFLVLLIIGNSFLGAWLFDTPFEGFIYGLVTGPIFGFIAIWREWIEF